MKRILMSCGFAPAGIINHAFTTRLTSHFWGITLRLFCRRRLTVFLPENPSRHKGFFSAKKRGEHKLPIERFNTSEHVKKPIDLVLDLNIRIGSLAH